LITIFSAIATLFAVIAGISAADIRRGNLRASDWVIVLFTSACAAFFWTLSLYLEYGT